MPTKKPTPSKRSTRRPASPDQTSITPAQPVRELRFRTGKGLAVISLFANYPYPFDVALCDSVEIVFQNGNRIVIERATPSHRSTHNQWKTP